MRNKGSLQTDERGMAAIIVTVVLMAVITMIALGFAQTVRREQRNALDHQLATQAYYAAESGVNLAQNKIKGYIANGDSIPAKTDCGRPASGFYSDLSDDDFKIGDETEITCLLVESKLKNLQYQNVGLAASPALVRAETGSIDTISISWQSSSTSSTTGCGASVGNFPANNSAPSDCKQPVLRVDIVPLPASGNLTRSELLSKQFTTFLYPTTGSFGAISYGAGSTTGVNGVTCGPVNPSSNPKACTVQISGLPTTLGYGRSFGVRIMAVYGTADVMIMGGSVASPVDLIDGQVLIDSTARSSDILRRVQVRASVAGSAPDFAAIGGGDTGLCKRFAINNATGAIDNRAVNSAGVLDPTVCQ